jgi:diadenosine tetraphosphate (Ap4A) HIT family hydrolase
MTSFVDGCFTCEVNRGRRPAPGGVILEDGRWLADHGTPELVRGYVVLKPRRHVESLGDLDPDESAGLGVTLQRLQAAMQAVLSPERIYVVAFGESVRHVHLHLIPRYAWMPATGADLVAQLFDQRWRCTPREAEEAAEAIRSALAG